MILVLGGIASGKRTYVRSLGYGDDQMADAALGSVAEDAAQDAAGAGASALSADCPVLLNAQELVRAGCEDALDGKAGLPEGLVDALCAKQVVTCLEVGNGVIPLERADRVWRERVGHLACELAARADRVVRVVCGIPVDLA